MKLSAVSVSIALLLTAASIQAFQTPSIAFHPRRASSLMTSSSVVDDLTSNEQDHENNQAPNNQLDKQSSSPGSKDVDSASPPPPQEEDFSEEPANLASEKDALTDLLRIASSTGRGEFATPTQKDQALLEIEALEAQNPNPSPTQQSSALIQGRWELLYSSTQLFRSSPFFMAGRATCSTPEQAEQYDWFCDMHRAALAISNIGAVRQVISENRMVSEFEVKVGAVPFLSNLTPFRYSGGLPLTIEGAIVSSADIASIENGTAWEIFMDTVEIRGSNVPLLRQVLDRGLKLASRGLGSLLESTVSGYSNPKPIFRTTYLSESIRISRDQDGKVFVYGKVSDDTKPTDYQGVMPDLGLTKLAAGFNDAVTKWYL